MKSYTPGVWDKHTEGPDIRFDRLTQRTEECWLWTGKKHTKTGRALFRLGSRLDGSRRAEHASRYAWQRWMGPIPAGLDVCHECDNMLCVRPAHLWLGTRYENNRDRCWKGRCGRGKKHPPQTHGRPPVKYAIGVDP